MAEILSDSPFYIPNRDIARSFIYRKPVEDTCKCVLFSY